MPNLMTKDRAFLVIGSRSRIGSAIADRLSAHGAMVYRTSRRPADVDAGFISLDLDDGLNGWTPPRNLTAAFLCAGVTSLDRCRRQPEATRRVNVAATLRLVDCLAEAGVFTVFLSSNWVFDGRQPHVAPDAPLAPRIEYGRQKREVEEGLARYHDLVAVLRMTKVVDCEMPLLVQWRDDLMAGRTILPFTDFPASMVPLPQTLEALIAVAVSRQGGIWQISARDDRSYADLARSLAAGLNRSSGLIAPRQVADSGIFFEDVPRHTTLDTSRLEQTFGWRTPVSEDAIRYFLKGGAS